MSKKQKQLMLGSLVLLSFFSSIYLNVELKAIETSVVYTEGQALPDVNIIKSLIRMVLEPLKLA